MTGLALIAMVLWIMCPAASALDFNHQLGVRVLSIKGKTIYETSFPEGNSRLEWPIEATTGELAYQVSWRNSLEAAVWVSASPWKSLDAPMEDYDWIDETYYSERPFHDALDIYSRSSIESKSILFGARSRFFFLSNTFCSLGLNVGYQFQEFDYRASNTDQVGYGPWRDQTTTVSGPVALYSVRYSLWNLGVSVRGTLEDIITITFDSMLIPEAQADDEDVHLRRSRVSWSSCTGSGTMTSLSTVFHTQWGWDVMTQSILSRIRTKGFQSQYWYGDDPATNWFDDTGQRLTGIRSKIHQNIFTVSLGAAYRF
ncbi:MAG: omptin family outer membrane protease [Desulfomonilia bacterium]|nr:omptin family outer membrane protease [Desulfomonilia bacterium]